MKTKHDQHMLGDELSLEMEIDIDVGEELDTRCSIDGEWWVAGSQRLVFARKLKMLIEEYRI